MDFTLRVSDKEVEIIGGALMELPFKLSVGIINSIQRQINDQKAAFDSAAVAAEVPEEKKK